MYSQVLVYDNLFKIKKSGSLEERLRDEMMSETVTCSFALPLPVHEV